MIKRTVNGVTVMIPKNRRDIFIKNANLSDGHYRRVDCFDSDILANFEQFLKGLPDE